jgi:hypothetical protein
VEWLSRLPVPLALISMFGAGAWRAATTDGVDGMALMAISILLTGIYVAVILHDKWGDRDSGDWPR